MMILFLKTRLIKNTLTWKISLNNYIYVLLILVYVISSMVYLYYHTARERQSFVVFNGYINGVQCRADNKADNNNLQL